MPAAETYLASTAAGRSGASGPIRDKTEMSAKMQKRKEDPTRKKAGGKEKRKKRIVFLTLAISTYNTPFVSYLADNYSDEFDVYVIHGLSFVKNIPKSISRRVKLVAASEINPFKNRVVRKVTGDPESFTHYFLYYPQLSEILDRIRPDIVHSMLYFMPYTWQAAKYCRKNSIPLLISEEIQHEPKGFLQKMLNRVNKALLSRHALHQAAHIIASTKQGFRFQKRFFRGLPKAKEKFVHIPWVVNEERMLKVARKDERNDGRRGHGAKLRLVVVARLLPFKEHETILDALAILKRKAKGKGFGFSMDFIGRGPLEERIKDKVKRLGLENEVRVHDRYYSENEMAKKYLKSDILILASRYEAFGMVVPEAMSYGCAVIISDTAGTNFMVKDGVNGFVFRTGDPEDLADRIIRAASPLRRLKELKEGSRRLMASEFSAGKIVRRYVTLIRGLTREGRRGGSSGG